MAVILKEEQCVFSVSLLIGEITEEA